MAEEKGVWRTIRGRRVFIRSGQSLREAMITSGKFNRTDIREARKESSFADTTNKALKEEPFSRKQVKITNKYLGKYGVRGINSYNEDEKNKINPDANIEGSGKTRVQRNWNKYSEEQRREVRQELIQKKLKEYKEDNFDKYKGTKHIGFGDYNDDDIPVYQNKIDYTGDFSNAKLDNLSNEELSTALSKQKELYNQALNENIGDQRTRNGRMDKIFNTAKRQKYEAGVNKITEEFDKRFNKVEEQNDLLRTQLLAKMNKQEENENKQEKINPATGRPIHKLGQLNETDEEVNINDYKNSNYFDKHEAERLDIARDIAKEIYGLNEKNSTQEKIDKYAKELLQPQDGEVLEKGETLYTNQKGELERSTKSLKEWRDELRKTSENKTFTQHTDMYGGTREYDAEQLKKMEENKIKPMEHSYTGGGWQGTNYDSNLSTKDIAKNITNYSKKEFPDVKVERETSYNTVDLYITNSEKDLFITEKDIDNMTNKELVDLTNNYGNQMFFDRWAKDNVPTYSTEHKFSADDVRRYMKEDIKTIKSHSTIASGNEYYLSKYGKKVVSGLNREMNSYNYDDDDGMVDYFNSNFYGYVNIGRSGKPYTTTNKTIDNFKRRKGIK